MEDINKIGLAIVGLGSYAECIANALVKSNKIKLISCFDRTEEKRYKFAEKYNCKSSGSLQEILEDKDIKGVILVTPNDVHCEHTLLAAKYKKHVFVDKPIANSISDAKKMINACKDAGVILAVGHNSRRKAAHRKMKSLIDEGVVGKVIMAETNLSYELGLNLKPSDWRWYRDRCPSGPFMQLGIHHADTLNYLLGPVNKVSSFMNRLATPAEIDDVIVTILEFKQGVLGYIGTNYATPVIIYFNIYGTEANIFCNNWSELFIQKKGSSNKERIKVNGDDPLIKSILEEMEEFTDCIITGRKPEVSGKEAIEALAIVEAAIKSNIEGRTVSISEVLG